MDANELVRVVQSAIARRGEDSRIEFKRELPKNERKAARQLAALCNAARSEWVLWIVGVDDDGRVVGGTFDTRESWWARTRQAFDEVAPRLLCDLLVTVENGQVLALLFDATQRPYVWISPSMEGSGPVHREVPWRQNATTRSANRGELLSILLSATRLPEIVIVSGDLYRLSRGSQPDEIAAHCAQWEGTVYIEVIPRSPETTTMVLYRCRARLLLPNLEQWRLLYVGAEASCKPSPGAVVHVDGNDMIIKGPAGAVLNLFSRDWRDEVLPSTAPLKLKIELFFAGARHPWDCTVDLMPRLKGDPCDVWDVITPLHQQEIREQKGL